jgi:hypothetical protein
MALILPCMNHFMSKAAQDIHDVSIFINHSYYIVLGTVGGKTGMAITVMYHLHHAYARMRLHLQSGFHKCYKRQDFLAKFINGIKHVVFINAALGIA